MGSNAGQRHAAAGTRARRGEGSPISDRKEREEELRRLARLYKGEPLYNIAQMVMDATTKRDIRQLVMDLAQESLRPEEQALRSFLLHEVATGKNVAEALRIEALERVGHPPRDRIAKAAAEEVWRRITERDKRGKAKADVREIIGKDEAEVHTPLHPHKPEKARRLKRKASKKPKPKKVKR